MCRTKVIDLSEGISQHAWYPCTISYPYSQLAQTTFWLRVSQSFESLRFSSSGPQEALPPVTLSQGGFVYPLRMLIVRTEKKTLSSGTLPGMESLSCSWDAFSQSYFGQEFRYHLSAWKTIIVQGLLNCLLLEVFADPHREKGLSLPFWSSTRGHLLDGSCQVPWYSVAVCGPIFLTVDRDCFKF